MHWPRDSLTVHVIVDLITTGGAAPKILSLASRVIVPGGVGAEEPTFHSYVKTELTGGGEPRC